MSKKVYRTSQGKTVDLGALQLQNESVRAVGNMGVNARGDKITPQGKTIESRTANITRQYKKQTRNNVTDDVVVDSRKKPKKQQADTATNPPVEHSQVAPEPVLQEEFVCSRIFLRELAQ